MDAFNSAFNGASASTNVDEIDTLWARIEQFEQQDREKTKFMKDLLLRYQYACKQNKALTEARQRERNESQGWLFEKQQYEDHIVTLQMCLERDPFVLLLIDGDGMVFTDKFIKAGEDGGRKAAATLQAIVLKDIQQYLELVPNNIKVVCRVYANVRGLADVLTGTGIINHQGTFEEFASGFTRGKVLFDFIDVGPGKDRADEKISETLKLYINDLHCRQLYFGCSHDNGYARVLEDYVNDDSVSQRLTLLEGVPFEKEPVTLPFRTMKFPDLFRDTKLTIWGASVATATNGGSKNYNIIHGLPTRFPPPNRNDSTPVLDSPIPAHVTPNIPRTPSTSTLASDGGAWQEARPKPMNWAAKAAAPAPPQAVTETLEYRPMNRDEVIARNRQGQRVDPPCRDYDKTEVDRIKKLKMCNVHFLRRECPYGEKCTHSHSYKPTPDEIRTLKLVARMAPCIYGSGCSDIKCIYGHRCPAPPRRSNAKGTKSCLFGDQCKFPPELHDIDTNVVKTLVIR